MLGVDGVHERLDEPERPRRRLTAAGMDQARQERLAFHGASLPAGFVVAAAEYRAAGKRLPVQRVMTAHNGHLTPEDEGDLAALADGCLHGPRRAELEARVAATPCSRPRSRASARRST